jgi:hypothetical protein
MKKQILLILVLAAVTLTSCRRDDHHHHGPVVPTIDRITIMDIDPFYPDFTAFEGRPDIFVEVEIGGQIVAVTDVNQAAYIPFTTRSRDLPLNMLPEDDRRDVFFHIWDRDPNGADRVGTVVWMWEDRYEGFQPHAENFELWDGFGNRLVLDVTYH